MQKLSRIEQKEQTRTGLVERAENLFAKKGISATSTADIAKALRVSHGTVFIHFATRDELVLAVIEKFGERLSLALGEVISKELTLKELLRSHVCVLSEFEDFYLRLIAESQALTPHIRSLVYAMNSSLSYHLSEAGKEMMDRGEIKKMRQADFFNTWMALLHYHILNRDLFSEETPILNHLGEKIVQHFFLLIKTGGKS